jgi:hypothetical protein
MAESETEAETLERLETALRKIAAVLGKPKPLPSGEINRAALVASLDRIIVRLRDGLAPTQHNSTE